MSSVLRRLCGITLSCLDYFTVLEIICLVFALTFFYIISAIKYKIRGSLKLESSGGKKSLNHLNTSGSLVFVYGVVLLGIGFLSAIICETCYFCND